MTVFNVMILTLVMILPNVELFRDILIYYVVFEFHDPTSKYSRFILFTDRQTDRQIRSYKVSNSVEEWAENLKKHFTENMLKVPYLMISHKLLVVGMILTCTFT